MDSSPVRVRVILWRKLHVHIPVRSLLPVDPPYSSTVDVFWSGFEPRHPGLRLAGRREADFNVVRPAAPVAYVFGNELHALPIYLIPQRSARDNLHAAGFTRREHEVPGAPPGCRISL